MTIVATTKVNMCFNGMEQSTKQHHWSDIPDIEVAEWYLCVWLVCSSRDCYCYGKSLLSVVCVYGTSYVGPCVTCFMWMAHVVYGMHGGVSELGLLFGPHEIIALHGSNACQAYYIQRIQP